MPILSLDEARAAGLTKAQLRGKKWRRVGPRVYASHEMADNQQTRLEAALRRLPDGACFSGPSGAFLHAIDRQCIAIEATLPPATTTSRLAGIAIRRCYLTSDEIVVRKGLPVTSAMRTVIDLACRLHLIDAVVIIDAALHMRLTCADQLRAWAAAHAGHRGVAKLRRAIEYAEPASESPMETRLRLVLVLGGLPKPRVQISLHDDRGIFLGRADLYYPEQRLAIEYDGATHRDSLAADNRRQNRMLQAGYRLLRFTASDVLGDPASVVAIVRKAVGASESAMPQSGVAESG